MGIKCLLVEVGQVSWIYEEEDDVAINHACKAISALNLSVSNVMFS